MATDLRTFFTSRGVTPRRALVAAGVAAAITVPGGVALAAVTDGSSPLAAPAATSTVTGATTLGAAEREGLEYMRQEEKLAGDVYAALYDAWGLQVFANIGDAEQTHQTEVAAIMARRGVDDPVAGLAPGEFVDPDLQALYDELVARGRTSVEEALRVGALVEELDIADLRARVSGDADIDALYARLEQGSQNHLRAFVRNLERLGVTYEPEVLDADDYTAILDGESAAAGHESGRGQARGRGHGNGGHDQASDGAGHGRGGDRGHGAGHGLADGTGPAMEHSS